MSCPNSLANSPANSPAKSPAKARKSVVDVSDKAIDSDDSATPTAQAVLSPMSPLAFSPNVGIITPVSASLSSFGMTPGMMTPLAANWSPRSSLASMTLKSPLKSPSTPKPKKSFLSTPSMELIASPIGGIERSATLSPLSQGEKKDDKVLCENGSLRLTLRRPSSVRVFEFRPATDGARVPRSAEGPAKGKGLMTEASSFSCSFNSKSAAPPSSGRGSSPAKDDAGGGGTLLNLLGHPETPVLSSEAAPYKLLSELRIQGEE